MNHKEFIHNLKNKHFEYLRSKELEIIEDCNDKAEELSEYYLQILINHMTYKYDKIVKSGKLIVPMGPCKSDCKDILSEMTDEKLRSKLPDGVTLIKNINQKFNCDYSNPGFLGLYNLTSKTNKCQEYYTFDYIINLNETEL